MTSTNAAPKLSVEEVRLYERDQTLRMPFRFGVATMTESPQAYAHVRIRLADGREGWGVAGEMLHFGVRVDSSYVDPGAFIGVRRVRVRLVPLRSPRPR